MMDGINGPRTVTPGTLWRTQNRVAQTKTVQDPNCFAQVTRDDAAHLLFSSCSFAVFFTHLLLEGNREDVK
jgi:hypothetical protein